MDGGIWEPRLQDYGGMTGRTAMLGGSALVAIVFRVISNL